MISDDNEDGLYGLLPLNTTIVTSEQELQRHLAMKSMLCFYKQGLEHRDNDDRGLANRCFSDAMEALNYAAECI